MRGLGAGGGAKLKARLQLMDRAGVQMQVLSACPQLPYGEDGQKAARAARFVNDQYAGLVPLWWVLLFATPSIEGCVTLRSPGDWAARPGYR